jgi:hypothetical protein
MYGSRSLGVNLNLSSRQFTCTVPIWLCYVRRYFVGQHEELCALMIGSEFWQALSQAFNKCRKHLSHVPFFRRINLLQLRL